MFFGDLEDTSIALQSELDWDISYRVTEGLQIDPAPIPYRSCKHPWEAFIEDDCLFVTFAHRDLFNVECDDPVRVNLSSLALPNDRARDESTDPRPVFANFFTCEGIEMTRVGRRKPVGRSKKIRSPGDVVVTISVFRPFTVRVEEVSVGEQLFGGPVFNKVSN